MSASHWHRLLVAVPAVALCAAATLQSAPTMAIGACSCEGERAVLGYTTVVPRNGRIMVRLREAPTGPVILRRDATAAVVPARVVPHEGVSNALWVVPEQLLDADGRYSLTYGSDVMVVVSTASIDTAAPSLVGLRVASDTGTNACDAIVGRRLLFDTDEAGPAPLVDVRIDAPSGSSHLLIASARPVGDIPDYSFAIGHGSPLDAGAGVTCLGSLELGFGREDERMTLTVRAIDGAGNMSAPVVLDGVTLLRTTRGSAGCAARPAHTEPRSMAWLAAFFAFVAVSARRRRP